MVVPNPKGVNSTSQLRRGLKTQILPTTRSGQKTRTNMPPMWPTGWYLGTTTICQADGVEKHPVEVPAQQSKGDVDRKFCLVLLGYKFIHDPRGFDILPDATHGSSGFLTKKELEEFLELGSVTEVKGMMLGRGPFFQKARPWDRSQIPIPPAGHSPTGTG